MPAGAAAAASARIGDARSIYHDGVFSHFNQAAAERGARPEMPIKAFVDMLLAAVRDRG